MIQFTHIVQKISLLSFALFFGMNVSVAQDATRHIAVEAFGAQNTIGINYDARLKGNSGLGYRIGIGYGYGNSSGLFDQKVNGVAIPLELNYLLGKKKSKLEIGFGTSIGMYHINESVWVNTPSTPSEPDYTGGLESVSSNRMGYFLFGNIGYRYQPKRGFVFRIGITPSFNFGDKHGINRDSFYPYIGFGKSF